MRLEIVVPTEGLVHVIEIGILERQSDALSKLARDCADGMFGCAHPVRHRHAAVVKIVVRPVKGVVDMEIGLVVDQIASTGAYRPVIVSEIHNRRMLGGARMARFVSKELQESRITVSATPLPTIHQSFSRLP